MNRAASKKEHTKKAGKAKVVPLKKEDVFEEEEDAKTLLQQAIDAQKENELPTAEKLYKAHIAQKGFEPSIYTRLMIVLRKQKKYKEELQLIEKAIKLLEAQYVKQQQKRKISQSVQRLSTGLNKSLGLTDTKGKAVFKPEQLLNWEKRKTTVEKKIKEINKSK